MCSAQYSLRGSITLRLYNDNSTNFEMDQVQYDGLLLFLLLMSFIVGGIALIKCLPVIGIHPLSWMDMQTLLYQSCTRSS